MQKRLKELVHWEMRDMRPVAPGVALPGQPALQGVAIPDHLDLRAVEIRQSNEERLPFVLLGMSALDGKWPPCTRAAG